MPSIYFGAKVGMIYVPFPSLEHLSAIKVAIVLWSQRGMRSSLDNFHLHRFSFVRDVETKWMALEDTVNDKLNTLILPELLKIEVSSLIKPIGSEILKWKQFHQESYELDIFLPDRLYWTPHATIDKKKIAEMLVNDTKLNLRNRYEIACIYCLESKIRELWGELPKELKYSFCSRKDQSLYDKVLPVYWAYFLEETDMNGVFSTWANESPLQFVFRHAVHRMNKSAAEFFMQKLTPAERRTTLEGVLFLIEHSKMCFLPERLSPGYRNEVVAFLLLQMDERQTEIIKPVVSNVLRAFLEWPWLNIFMQVANRLWDILPDYDYEVILHVIFMKLIILKDYNYNKLFTDFWQQSPVAYKKYVIHKYASSWDILLDLFITNHKENIQMIIQDATFEEQKQIISFYEQENVCITMHRAIWYLKCDIKQLMVFKKQFLKFLKALVYQQVDHNPPKRAKTL